MYSYYIPVTCSYHHPYLYWSTFFQQIQPERLNFHSFLHGETDLNQDRQAKLNDNDAIQSDSYIVPIGFHELPRLSYSYEALEPYIDAKTMHLHYKIHHKSYVDGLNKAEKALQQARETDDYSLVKHWQREIAFHGAGHYLHTIFWSNMSPSGGGEPDGLLAREIIDTFGSVEAFKKHFSAAAEKVEGSGWAIFIWSPRAGRTDILQIEKHQNLSQQDMVPLLVLDMWEHAYYLQYNANRSEYIKAWWNIVNWRDVEKRFNEACKIVWNPI